MLKIIALAFAPLSVSIRIKFFPCYSEWPYSLLCIVIVHWNPAISQEHTEILFLVYAVCQNSSDDTVVSELAVLEFYPLEISIYLVF